MAEDFVETQRPTELPPVPPADPLHETAEADDSTLRLQTEGALTYEASGEASRWTLLPSSNDFRVLKARWQEAADSIEKAFDEAGSCDPVSLSDSARWFTENIRLLQSALKTTRHAFRSMPRLPRVVVVGGKGTPLPRAYMACAGFLHATAYVFEERALEVYFRALQSHGALESDELWALQPMMQLLFIEEVATASKRLATPNARAAQGDQDPGVSLATLVTGLREVVDADWKELFERLSETEWVLREDPADVYPRMDSETRSLYRGVVRELASCCQANELEVAQKALACARAAQSEWNSNPRLGERRNHVGYYLVDKGRETLEGQIGYRAPFSERIRRIIRRAPETIYLVSIELLVFAIIAFVLNGFRAAVPVSWALLLLLIPATESAIGVVNQLVSALLPARILPKLDFSQGIPEECTTVVAVPTLLISEQQVRQIVRDLEIRYLGNRDANLHFALLTDSPDSPQPSDDRDTLIALCGELVAQLNAKYCQKAGGCFFHLHRNRTYNPREGAWMGWERKRGKLLDFNNLLRGGSDSFPVKVGDLSILPSVRYVVTLDVDTQLPRESAHRLVGAMAHPLNRAVIDPATNTVVEGYGILQPSVGISVRSANRSRLANIYSGQTGLDTYTRAVSNVYQDLLGEGSFTGKGIYEVDVFQQVLSKRFPTNAILSHDLIEGAYARAGLVSDIEVIDDYPSHFSAHSRRKHRWVRGDWQIMRWLLLRVPDYSGRMVANPITLASRWKILDNLRRSLVEMTTFALLLAGWSFLPGGPTHWTRAVLALLLIPSYIRLLLSISTIPKVESLRGTLADIAAGFIDDQLNVFMLLAFLAHQTLVTLDAIVRTLVRLTITRRRLLQWETAAESEIGGGKKTPIDLYLKLTPFVCVTIALLIAVVRPKTLLVAGPVLLLWACSGLLARWLDRPLRPGRSQMTKADGDLLRQAGLRTWRYFRAFSNAENNWLIPDNLQDEPPSVAYRISPTNLGLLLNARIAAYELGYLTLDEFVTETEKTLATAKQLARYRGHFFNWYDTRSLQPEAPRFVSTVDSGNLACCLWTLKQCCLQMSERPVAAPARLWEGIRDHAKAVVELAHEIVGEEEVTSAAAELEASLRRLTHQGTASWQGLTGLERALASLDESLLRCAGAEAQELRWWITETESRVANLRVLAETLAPFLLPECQRLLAHREVGLPSDADGLALGLLPAFLRMFESRLVAVGSDANTDEETKGAARSIASRLPHYARNAEDLHERLLRLAQESDALVQEMDFRFLYNRQRKALSIGYNEGRPQIEKSCYDLLASEARTAAFVAVAKGDIPQECWFNLGRSFTACGGKLVLLSWSGTMFEYLMPALWMKTHPNTLLDRSLRVAVSCQHSLSKRRSVPWGISESACARRDEADRYQYHAFGLRALAVMPKMHPGLVIAPYASFLALAVDTSAAAENIQAMKARGWLGRFGFFEAADFTGAATSKDCELVRCWMAHHQGMSLLSVCNLLAASAVQNLFHAEPMVAATERLLHERFSRTTPVVSTGDLEAQEV